MPGATLTTNSSIASDMVNSSPAPQLPVEPKPEPSIFQKLGIGFAPPAQAEYGADAYPSILKRISSGIALVVVTVFLGVLVAGVIGSVILVALFLLEQAISS